MPSPILGMWGFTFLWILCCYPVDLCFSRWNQIFPFSIWLTVFAFCSIYCIQSHTTSKKQIAYNFPTVISW